MRQIIKVLNFVAGEEAKIIKIENNITELQKLVEGYIEIVPITENLCIICNELGKTEKLSYQEKYNIYGNFIVAQTYNNKLISINESTIDKIMNEVQNFVNTSKQRPNFIN